MPARSLAALAALCLIGSSTFAMAQDKPTDPQIAHIAYTAGTIDIEAAKLAVQKSKTQAVVDFANDMIRDHEAVNQQALDLVKKLDVTPQDNATSQSLSKAAADERPAAAAEIDRLSRRVEALEKRIAGLETGKPQNALPTDEEFERTMGFMERFFRRFMGMMQDFQHEQKPGQPSTTTPDRT